jgi:hypothetical protein
MSIAEDNRLRRKSKDPCKKFGRRFGVDIQELTSGKQVQTHAGNPNPVLEQGKHQPHAQKAQQNE